MIFDPVVVASETTALKRAADLSIRALTACAFEPVAKVWDSDRALDVVARMGDAKLILLRCVAAPTPGDRTALKTMLRAGEFQRAVLVQCDRELSPSPDMETCSIDNLPRLLARRAVEGESS